MKTVLLALVGFAQIFLRSAAAADFTVTNTNDAGAGSLAQAILDANAAPGADRIVFNIPGAGVQRIDLSQHAPPEVTDPITIDGYTQPGARANALSIGDDAIILIQLDGGESSDAVSGLRLSAGDSTIRGLSITGFGGSYFQQGIYLLTRGGNVIEGNFFGLNPDGTRGVPASFDGYSNYVGLAVVCDHNRIGGATPAARNIFCANETGILLSTLNGNPADEQVPDLRGNQILGNYLGPRADGFTSLANGGGVELGRGIFTGTVIGPGNVISGNSTGIASSRLLLSPVPPQGVFVADDFAIVGNFIGTTADGIGSLGNAQAGVGLEGNNISLGGLDPAAGNIIAFNGVGVLGAPGNPARVPTADPVLSNLIYGNVNGDIGTSAFPNRNDSGDRQLPQNYPILTSVGPIMADGSRAIAGGLSSKPDADFTIQIFRYAPAPNSKPALLKTLNLHTDSNGLANFQFSYSAAGETPSPDEFFTASATDGLGNTSAFMPRHGLIELANLSTRGFVGAGDNLIVGGFVIDGALSKRLLVRALGPSIPLAEASLGGRLADPVLEIFSAKGELLARNDDWKLNSQNDLFNLTTSHLQPASDLESALFVELPAGSYTVQMRGANGGTGVGVVEIYDLSTLASDSGRLSNLSTRGRVGTGDDVLIGGFIALGDAPARTLIRAIGPDLAGLGVSEALRDPTLELRDASGNLIAADDNWRDTQAEEISATTIPPNDERDAAIVATLIPGNYTAIVRGKDGATGVSLVEFYDLK